MIDGISSFSSVLRTPSMRATEIETTAASAAAGAAGVGAPAPVGTTSFSDVFAEVANGAVSALKQGEATSIYGVQGKASVQRVVEAIMNAEQSLQTAVAVRDKVVAAYQEVSRMSI